MTDNVLYSERYHLATGRPKKHTTKRLISCVQTLEKMGLNPFYEIARIAVIAEKNGDLPTASTNWRFLGEYVDAKRKAIDPTENALKEKQLLTLDQLGSLKQLILSGNAQEVFDQADVIDQEPAPDPVSMYV